MATKKFYGKTLQNSSMLPGGGFAGLPENVVMKSYADKSPSLDFTLNDSLSGLDEQILKDSNGIKGQLAKNKY